LVNVGHEVWKDGQKKFWFMETSECEGPL